jgi:hypothetical protein
VGEVKKRNPTHYLAVHRDVRAIERIELLQFLMARSNGITEDEGGLDRMGFRLRTKMSHQLEQRPSAAARNGFPRGTDGHPPFQYHPLDPG